MSTVLKQPKQKRNWAKKAERFAKIRAHILQVLGEATRPLDMAQIMLRFKRRFNYLPYIERRMYELMEDGFVTRIPGAIPTYRLSEA